MEAVVKILDRIIVRLYHYLPVYSALGESRSIQLGKLVHEVGENINDFSRDCFILLVGCGVCDGQFGHHRDVEFWGEGFFVQGCVICTTETLGIFQGKEIFELLSVF